MGSYFHGQSAPAHGSKRLVHPFLGGRHAAFRHDLALAIQHAIPAAFISQVHADGHRPCMTGWSPLRTLVRVALWLGAILLHGWSSFAIRLRFLLGDYLAIGRAECSEWTVL